MPTNAPTNVESPSTSTSAVRPATSASEIASTQRRAGEPVYNSMPTPSFVRPAMPANSATAAPPAPTATELVTRPDPHSLAAGKYEAKPFQIWLLVIAGAVFALIYLLVRVRLSYKKKQRATDALTSVLRRAPSQPSR
jgi:hypothetical protein